MKTNRTKKTQELTGYVQVSLRNETMEERQIRCRALADEKYHEFHRQRKIEEAELEKRLAAMTPYKPEGQTGETTIVEDDYQYRKAIRETMEESDADMFSYNW